MCGIAGILRVHPPGQAPPPPEVAIPEAWLDILDDSIKHRGPDGHGRFRDRAFRPDGSTVDVALVHRRLSIIDHAGGHQPMVLRARRASEGRNTESATQDPGPRTQDSLIPPGADPSPYRRTLDHALNPCPRCAALGRGTIAVAFNGCIYNHRDLRKELQAAGHVFSTDHSDTEVLVHGSSEWGPRLPHYLDAMYGYAAWDGDRGAVTLVRDRFGEKPLYFAAAGAPPHRLEFFSSCVPGLARVMKSVDGAAWVHEGPLAEWISHGHLGFSSPIERLRILRSGETAVLSGSDIWSSTDARSDLQLDPGPRERTQPPLTLEEVDRLLSQAVASRLEADVPLGCFLSGGVDSSLVAAYAKKHAGDLATFTVRMPSAAFDESAHADRVARVIGTRHTLLDCDPSPATDLHHVVRQLGLPFGDSSLLPTHWVSRAVRACASVALSGDGGDELFAGYERYDAVAVLRRFRPLLARLPARVLLGGDPRSRAHRLGRLAEAARGAGYSDIGSVFPTALRPSLFGRWFGQMRDPFASKADAILHDALEYLPEDLLRKVDTASMAVALEVRAPLLQRNLAGRALGTPISSLLPRGQRKGLLRAVARKYFPPEIVDRPKQGFAIPIGEWFRTDYGGMRQLLLDHLNGPEPFGPDALGINAMINMAFVKQMLREHDDAGAKSLWPWKGRDHSQRLYMLLVLSIWAKWLGSL